MRLVDLRALCCVWLLVFILPVLAQDESPQVTPLLDCVIDFGNGYRTAVFRYENPDTSPVIAQSAEDNFFTPAVDVQPPRILRHTPRPGVPDVSFEVPFTGDSLTWTLFEQSVTATPDSESCPLDDAFTVMVDPAMPYQIINGFGGAYVFRFSKTMDRGEVDRVAQMTFDLLQPTHMRFNMPLDRWEPQNDNDDPAVLNMEAFVETDRIRTTLAMMQKAQDNDALIHASVWAAPDWMVDNPADTRQRIVDPVQYDEFVESMLAYLLYARDVYGVEVDTVSLNEPDLGVFQSFTPSEYAEIMRLSMARFAEAGLTTRWVLGETSNMSGAVDYAQAIWTESDIRPHVAAWAYHSWDAAAPDAELEDNAFWTQETGLQTWITEMGFDPLSYETPEVFPTFDFALNTARIYSRVYKLTGANVTFHWQLLDDYRVISPDGETLFPTFFVLQSLRNYVPVGAQVIASSDDVAGLYSLAVQTPEGGINLLLVNMSDRYQGVMLRDLPGGDYQLWRISAIENLESAGIVTVSSDEAALMLMGRSVNWLVAVEQE